MGSELLILLGSAWLMGNALVVVGASLAVRGRRKRLTPGSIYPTRELPTSLVIGDPVPGEPDVPRMG